ncbi:arabinosylfuranosidase ArfA [Amycolatopsis magusensis]|uniref:non-reducing end alpha-L-arabinofuranosidase n=1 Tax=Amycolatopsis magusensis TaxID=882444 RepID=A0ABS4Q1I9_9PSEU|nr:alpha-N-arabinofuranosidase [Amycolatopsis magusensis]MBP2185542.1 alpha-N-arabinofuranosidase [Amycolatopsis magusensis]MDI5979249.1 alpha-N-arabinofuranosidase [Amycolatopsis magusensis]
MFTASVAISPDHVIAPVRRRLFGSFVEHMGRCVHTGIHEPGHPTADEDGFRGDVLALTRELGVELVRYPGGNFVSGYRWEDGIGPVADRPVRRDLAWHSIETNAVGVDEFVRWARKADVEVMYAVNLGTRGVAEALDVHEYVNHEGGTHLAELRRRNGAERPHDVRLWCLGNELDGPWQTGHKTAHEYGRLAAETARALRQAEPGLELVACGSSHSRMPTFGAWEATVLELAYDQVDHISCHAYYEVLDGDVDSFLASAVDMDRQIESVVATADAVGARLRSRKRIGVSFDEWNVWYQTRFQADPPTEWQVAPRLIEDTYDVADAVVVGNLLISLLRHGDRVTAACQAQLVNVIAPIRTEPGGPAWRQTTFHPFALTSRLARGHVLRTEITAPTHTTARHGDVPVVDAVATHDPSSGETVLFAVNRHRTEPVELRVATKAFGDLEVAESWILHDPDPSATNTEHTPDRVVPRPHPTERTDNSVRVVLPPISWHAIRLGAIPDGRH